MVTEVRSRHLGTETLGHAVARLWDVGRALSPRRLVGAAPTGDRARYHLGRARRALDRGDVQKAASEAVEAWCLDPGASQPLLVLGRCALAESRFADAVGWLDMAWERAPHNTYVLDLLLSACERAGEPGRRQHAIARADLRGTPVRSWMRGREVTAA